jgi:hypothetical protein
VRIKARGMKKFAISGSPRGLLTSTNAVAATHMPKDKATKRALAGVFVNHQKSQTTIAGLMKEKTIAKGRPISHFDWLVIFDI